jgi:hypothetical protein
LRTDRWDYWSEALPTKNPVRLTAVASLEDVLVVGTSNGQLAIVWKGDHQPDFAQYTIRFRHHSIAFDLMGSFPSLLGRLEGAGLVSCPTAVGSCE